MCGSSSFTVFLWITVVFPDHPSARFLGFGCDTKGRFGRNPAQMPVRDRRVSSWRYIRLTSVYTTCTLRICFLHFFHSCKLISIIPHRGCGVSSDVVLENDMTAVLLVWCLCTEIRENQCQRKGASESRVAAFSEFRNQQEFRCAQTSMQSSGNHKHKSIFFFFGIFTLLIPKNTTVESQLLNFPLRKLVKEWGTFH